MFCDLLDIITAIPCGLSKKITAIPCLLSDVICFRLIAVFGSLSIDN